MKKLFKYFAFAIVSLLLVITCERFRNLEPEIRINSVVLDHTDFSRCIEQKSYIDISSLEIRSKAYGYLSFQAINTEFCCETDSIIIGVNPSGDSVYIEIFDMGPYSWCFCNHDASFTLGPFKPEIYHFFMLESVDAYNRDTFIFSLDLSRSIDTILYPVDTISIFQTDTSGMPTDTVIKPPPVDTTVIPPLYLETIYSGCNTDTLNTRLHFNDTAYVTKNGNLYTLYTGLNYQCCAPFSANYSYINDTIIFIVKDNCTQPYGLCYCRCNCYYIFEFILEIDDSDYLYPYRIYVDNPRQGGIYLFWWGYLKGL